jgi:hypothetical protein
MILRDFELERRTKGLNKVRLPPTNVRALPKHKPFHRPSRHVSTAIHLMKTIMTTCSQFQLIIHMPY